VENCDLIKTDYNIKGDSCRLNIDYANIVDEYESTDVFQDEPLHTLLIQGKRRFITDVGIFALAFPFPLLMPFGDIALWCK